MHGKAFEGAGRWWACCADGKHFLPMLSADFVCRSLSVLLLLMLLVAMQAEAAVAGPLPMSGAATFGASSALS